MASRCLRRTMAWTGFAAMALLLASAGFAADASSGDEGASSLDDLLEMGRSLWEENMPDEVKEQYAFPDRADLDQFLADLQTALSDGTFEQLAAYEPQARQALRVLRMSEAGDELADWLEPRLDFLVTAAEIVSPQVSPEATPATPPARTRPLRPGETPPRKQPSESKPPQSQSFRESTHGRAYWHRVVASHPIPKQASRLVPLLKRAFRREGVPEEWVWIAEVESSMNPKARSPVGARGLFQFMPATAERFGLSTSWPDERLDPEKSARAAAAYLRVLRRQFDSWPLAIAAYNAGEGRIGRTLKRFGARDFESIAHAIPAETRLYVPKVLATVEVREAVDPEKLPAPRAVASGAAGNRRVWRVSQR